MRTRRDGRRLLVDLGKIGELASVPAKVDVGIISAFSPEVQAVLDRCTTILGKKTYVGRIFFFCKLKTKTVAITTCGCARRGGCGCAGRGR